MTDGGTSKTRWPSGWAPQCWMCERSSINKEKVAPGLSPWRPYLGRVILASILLWLS